MLIVKSFYLINKNNTLEIEKLSIVIGLSLILQILATGLNYLFSRNITYKKNILWFLVFSGYSNIYAFIASIFKYKLLIHIIFMIYLCTACFYNTVMILNIE